MALCIDIVYTHRAFLAIIPAASYSLLSSPPAPSLTSYSSLCIVQLPSVSVTLRVALIMSQSSPSYSPSFPPCLTRHHNRHHTRHVLLAIIPSASYSHPNRWRPHRHPRHHVVLIASCSSPSAYRIVLIASCSSPRAYRVVLIASCRIYQLSFVSNMQRNGMHIKTALLLDRGDKCDVGCLRCLGPKCQEH